MPATVSQNVCAALLGRSPKFVARLIDGWLLPAERGYSRRIPLAAIEEYRGHKVTAEDILAAKQRVSRATTFDAGKRETRQKTTNAGTTDHDR